MQPTDDALGLRLLGQVQELRAALDRLNDRAEARALKARLLTLHDASRGITVAPDVGKIVDEFFTMARALIVKSYGTAAWDEPESIEEAKARMGRLPSAPGSQYTADQQRDGEAALARAVRQLGPIAGPARHFVPGPLTDDELAALVERAEHGVWLTATPEDVQRLVAEVRRLRSDEWLEHATDEIGEMDTRDHIDTAKVLALLRKHRDGKA